SLSPEGRIRELNLSGARLLGTPRSHAIGLPFQLHIAVQDRSRFDVAIADAIANDGSGTCEATLKQRDSGKEILARITLTVLRRWDVRLLVAFEDVTAQRLAESALREADRRKDEFLALVSHELRSPLSVLLAHSMLLQKEDVEPKIR